MSEDLFDDDLFAVRPAPAPAPLRVRSAPKPAPVIPPAFVGPRWPVATLACDCGFREEVKEPCPDRLDCSHCRELEGLRRYSPRYLPPRGGGRVLTAIERRGLELDRVRNP